MFRLSIGILIFMACCACNKKKNRSELFPDVRTSHPEYRFNKNINYTLEPLYFHEYSPKKLIKYADTYVGTRYKAGGKTPNGFDCSGFAFFVHKRFGIYLPSSSEEMADVGTKIKLKNALPGDLIFFKGENKRDKHAGHVGIVVSKKGDPLKFIHASTSKGIRYDVLDENSYFRERFMFVKRIVGTEF